MSDAAVLTTRFIRPKDFDPHKHFSTSLGVMTGNGDHHVVIELDPWLTDILHGRRLHASQRVEQLPSGGSNLRLRLRCLEEIEQYVLSWGIHATVLEPEEFVNRVRDTVRTLAARYANPLLAATSGTSLPAPV